MSKEFSPLELALQAQMMQKWPGMPKQDSESMALAVSTCIP